MNLIFTDSAGSERLTISMKKKLASKASDGSPVSDIFEPYAFSSLYYISIHSLLSNTKSDLT
jgi:hypothetical protein